MRFFIKNFEEIIGGFFLLLMVVVVALNVILRYVFSFSLEMSEELSVSCFIWAIFLGASAAYKRKMHIGIEAVVILFPKSLQTIISFLIEFFIFILFLTVLVLSSIYTFTSQKPTSVLGISYVYINSGVTLSFALMLIHSALNIIKKIKLSLRRAG